MPIISIPEPVLSQRLGGKLTDDQIDEMCFQFGLELDEITSERELFEREQQGKIGRTQDLSSDKLYKIEVPANRYDLLCPEGLLRALLIFNNKSAIPRFQRLDLKTPCQMFVRAATQDVRPFVVAAILRDIELNEFRFKSLIDLQEKLHQNICRKRTLVAIGAHDLDTLQPPLYYDAQPPSEIRFVPLNKSEAYTAEQLMDLYSSDNHLKQYLPILQKQSRYPVITDSAGVILSMPPIINGQHSRVSVNTRNILLEATATDLHKACIVLDTLVTMYSEYCSPTFHVEPVEIIQHDGSQQLYPRLEYRDEVVSVDYINRLLGTQLSNLDVIKLLHRMGLAAEQAGTDSGGGGETLNKSSSPISSSVCNLISVCVPPTRHDILHACDIVEDVAIAYGYDNIPERLPSTYCIAQNQLINRLSDMIRAEIAQAGFTEALSFSLCSRDDISTRLRRDLTKEPAVHISNPKSSEFQVVRTSLLPGILHTLASNRSLPLPLKLFEVQDVVLKDPRQAVGASNYRRICAVYYNKTSGFEVIHGLLDHLMRSFSVHWKSHTSDINKSAGNLSYELRATKDPTYFDGRCADIILLPANRSIGRLGVLHPDVLRNFDLPMPCSVLDMELDVFV